MTPSTPAPYLAACFDLDGTLIDTESIHLSAEEEALASLGVARSRGRPRTFGMGIERGMELLASAFSLDADQLLDAYMPRWEAGLAEDLRLLSGVAEATEWLQRHGVPMALVTSGDRHYVSTVDSALGIASRFEVVVTSDDVQRAKPHPLPYIAAASRLGVDRTRTIGFEDSAAGLASLNAAGIFSVVVHPDYHQREDLSEARHSVTSLRMAVPLFARWFGQNEPGPATGEL